MENNNNNKLSTEQKERLLVGTLMHCNKIISELNESESTGKIKKVKKLFENCDEYKYNFMNLACLSTGNGIVMMREHQNEFMEEYNAVKMNERQNLYAYLSEVKSFLNGFELPVQHSLNESLNSSLNNGSLNIHVPTPRPLGGGRLIDNPKNLISPTMDDHAANNTPVANIEGFKRELDRYIAELDKVNDPENYSNDVLKIKLLARKPMLVYGFNIMNSLAFQSMMSKKYNVNNVDLLAILFNRIDNTILFVYRKNLIIRYNIKTDNFEPVQLVTSYNDDNYMEVINLNITYKLLVMYQDLSGLRYKTNIYGDEIMKANIDKMKNLIIKR